MRKSKGKKEHMRSECAPSNVTIHYLFYLDPRNKIGGRTTDTGKPGLLMQRKESLAS